MTQVNLNQTNSTANNECDIDSKPCANDSSAKVVDAITKKDACINHDEFVEMVKQGSGGSEITGQTGLDDLDIDSLASKFCIDECTLDEVVDYLLDCDSESNVEDLFNHLDANDSGHITDDDSEKLKNTDCSTDCGPTDPVDPVDPGADAGLTGSITGDPHFVGAHGRKYDIQGEEGKTYGIINDKHIAYNNTFTNPNNRDGRTNVGAVGFTIDGFEGGSPDQIQWSADRGGRPVINGERIPRNTLGNVHEITLTF